MLSHINKGVFFTMLNYLMASGNLTDENIKSLCCLLWIFETRIAITIMTDQYQHHNCEEDITMSNIIEINAQLYLHFDKDIILQITESLFKVFMSNI